MMHVPVDPPTLSWSTLVGLVLLCFAHLVVLLVDPTSLDCQARYGDAYLWLLFHGVQVGLLVVRVAVYVSTRLACCMSSAWRQTVDFYARVSHYAFVMAGTLALWVSPQWVITLPFSPRFWYRSWLAAPPPDCAHVPKFLQVWTDVLTRLETGSCLLLLLIVVLLVGWRGVWWCMSHRRVTCFDVAFEERKRTLLYRGVQCVTGVDVWDTWDGLRDLWWRVRYRRERDLSSYYEACL